jgi:hypothetical protein
MVMDLTMPWAAETPRREKMAKSFIMSMFSLSLHQLREVQKAGFVVLSSP